MDKTYNIGLGGFSFIMEEAAFNDLKNYIATLRQKWSADEDREEIIADIEYRMGELLQEHLKGRAVANRDDIKYLIDTMGMPNDLADDDLGENYAENGFAAGRHSATASTTTFANKKLYRDPYHRVLGGVASGLANYFGIDRIWIRLALVLAPFLDIVMMGISTSSLIILYIIAWIVIPKATTVSDMLQAKGEPVNAERIKEFKAANGELPPPRESFFRSALKILLKIIILTILISLVAVVLFIGFTVIGAIFFGSITIDYLPLLTENTWSFGVASTALIIALASIITGLILLSIKLISSSFRVHKAAKIAIPAVFIGSMIALLLVAGNEASNFTTKSSVNQKIGFTALPNDTITFSFNNEYESSTFVDDNFIIYRDIYNLNFINSKDAEIVIKKSSRGKNFKDAQEKLAKMNFPIKVSPNEIEIPNYFTLGKNVPLRKQKIELYIHMPNNVPFVVKGIQWITQFNQNHEYLSENKNVKTDGTPRVFMFIDGKLKCINCTDNDVKDENESPIDNDSLNIDGENLKLKADGKNENVELEIPGKIKIEANGKQQKVKIKLPDGKEIVNISE
ncbi:PspC domain-containing protein [Ornithobacterium rhinotracheale]|uniref:PspC domain-containing protein n=1 Tax=Ornithobacterium rhinotracheale TaxID=28251 RepID=UPI00129C1A20|nr:PspC domain-containing protein [Ornithobacterium rhinotracheale]MRJ08241.1 PspC domain-containing protein [Ornithobacterium rhinotracheale]UOH77437.1 PspC domain-containing protein [Ornithobacterium rhinotracheale]